MYPDGRHLTAFVTPWGLYEWIRIQTGLKNAAGEFHFSRFMEDCLRDFRDDFCEPYIDDVIVYSKSFKEHVELVRQVLRRLRENGIKLRANTCNLFQKEVCYLGMYPWRVIEYPQKTLRQWKNSEHMNLRMWKMCRSYQGFLDIITATWKTSQGLPNQFTTSYKSVLSVLNRTCFISSQQNENNQTNFRFHSKLLLCGKKNIGKHCTF